jgi:hypothetical protein
MTNHMRLVNKAYFSEHQNSHQCHLQNLKSRIILLSLDCIEGEMAQGLQEQLNQMAEQDSAHRTAAYQWQEQHFVR